jgi:hypothetical protein
MAERGRSPWLYVGIGCAVLAGLAVSAAVTLGVFGYRWARRTERELRDPGTRLARVREVLGCETLPAGYHPVVGLSLPLLTEVAVLSDRPPQFEKDAREPFGERGFIYVKALMPGQDEQELRDYFEGRTDDPDVFRRHRVRIRPHEVLRRGSLEGRGQTLRYIAQRGEIEFSEQERRGLTSLIMVDCPQDGRLRLGIWFGPDPAAGPESNLADLAGTPADPAAIQEFMGHFRLCGQAEGAEVPRS